MKAGLYLQRTNTTTTYLIDKKRCHELSRFEHIHHLADQIVVRRLGEVGFEADVGELRLRGDVDGPVSSLERTAQAERATLQRRLSGLEAAKAAGTRETTHVSLHSIH